MDVWLVESITSRAGDRSIYWKTAGLTGRLVEYQTEFLDDWLANRMAD